MPLLAMMYMRGPKVKNGYDVSVVKHAARVGAELGADIVKVPYTGSPESFREVVEGCFVPVVIAGGEKMETDRDILEMVKGSRNRPEVRAFPSGGMLSSTATRRKSFGSSTNWCMTAATVEDGLNEMAA